MLPKQLCTYMLCMRCFIKTATDSYESLLSHNWKKYIRWKDRRCWRFKSDFHSDYKVRCSIKEGNGRKEMFYLMTHSTHFIYGYMASDMVKDHSDSEKGNPLPPHRLLFPINSRFFYMHHPTDRITYHSLCYTSRGALTVTRNSSMGSPHEGSIRRFIAPWAKALTTELHLAQVR